MLCISNSRYIFIHLCILVSLFTHHLIQKIFEWLSHRRKRIRTGQVVEVEEYEGGRESGQDTEVCSGVKGFDHE